MPWIIYQDALQSEQVTNYASEQNGSFLTVYFLNYLPKNEFICLILISNEADKSKMRQKKLLCHKFHGTYFPPSCSSHLRLSYHPMSDDLCHLPMSHVHHYTLLFKTRDIADSHTRLIHHFTCHIFLYPSSSKVFRHLLDNLIGIVMEIVILYC